MKTFFCFFSSVLSIYLISCNNSDNRTDDSFPPPVPAISYTIGETLPHDTSYFTEGFEFYNNTLLESTGLNGKSKLVQVDPKTGKLIKQVVLDPKYFGEGITVLHDTIYQLTYQEHVVHVYSAKDFKKIKELPLEGEGWGMTNDGKNLIASNGKSSLYFYEPSTFRLIRELPVTESGSSVVNINELEYINGFVYANQWQYNYIIKINPANGEVVGKMDLSNEVNKIKAKDPHADFLNGIAYNPSTKKVYITGKLWPEIYEIQFAH